MCWDWAMVMVRVVGAAGRLGERAAAAASLLVAAARRGRRVAGPPWNVQHQN